MVWDWRLSSLSHSDGHPAGAIGQGVPRFFAGKRVLVTGAGGSVGSAVTMALAGFGCANLALLDFHDHDLVDIVERAGAVAGAERVVEILCDIRNFEHVSAWVARVEPDIVIHTAALKHVHLGERHPAQCVLTNLIGARNVLHAAVAAGAGQFLLVSTDKAAEPVCVMGASKRRAELYLTGFQMERQCTTALKSVRFGNVYGSQGSVAPRFAARIEAGEPLKVTHPDMQRYFISIEDSVALILNVAALDDESGRSGTYLMEMGELVSIMDLARDMIARSGKDIDIEVTGMRPGEKLREVLFDAYEAVIPSALENVYRVTPASANAYVVSADLAQLEALANSGDDALIRRRVFAYLDARLGRHEAVTG